MGTSAAFKRVSSRLSPSSTLSPSSRRASIAPADIAKMSAVNVDIEKTVGASEARMNARLDALEAKVDGRMETLQTKVDEATEPQSGWEQFVLFYRNFSYVWGLALVIFSLIIVNHGIAEQWNNPAWKDTQDDGHPALEIIFFFFMLTWIGLLEGC